MSMNGQDVSLDTGETETAASPASHSDSAIPERATRGTVTKNPVITAMSRIGVILDGFDQPTQHRILGFLAEQYGLVG